VRELLTEWVGHRRRTVAPKLREPTPSWVRLNVAGAWGAVGRDSDAE
jgi:hypothetical protein